MATSNRSVMTHQFSQVPAAEIQRSSFDRSHGHKTTFDGGWLVPIFVDEALPGDTFNLKMQGFGRLSTPIFPIMDNMFMETFFFAVPNRLLWENWERFNGEQDSPDESTDYLIPQVIVDESSSNTPRLSSYMGIPPLPAVGTLSVNSLPFRAYNLIWNEWFRDQNIQDTSFITKGDSPADAVEYPMRRRGKRHDYFTSCLPWPQKGDPVTLPLGTTAPITGLGSANATASANLAARRETGGIDRVYDFEIRGDDITDNIAMEMDAAGGAYPLVFADLTDATAVTINELREAFQIQRLFERDARGGTRYTEIIRSHFGVTSPDERLQRPEYLGGGSSPVIISPVAQTSETDPSGPDASPQANLAAIGTVSLNNHGFTKSFTEHCTLIGLVNVRADLTYQSGVNRMWFRETRFDFYWPALANLGEQAVLQREIFMQGSGGGLEDELVFGYQERYAEYRYKPSLITGLFNSAEPEPLDSWHLAQDFGASAPTLSDAFIQDTPPIERIIAVADEPHFIFDSYFSMRCARPMPLYGVPGLIDHF